MTAPERMAAYLERVAAAQLAHPEWRSGQTHFNVLYDVDPDAAQAVWATPFDPFYKDEHVRFMLAFLRTRWGLTNDSSQ